MRKVSRHQGQKLGLIFRCISGSNPAKSPSQCPNPKKKKLSLSLKTLPQRSLTLTRKLGALVIVQTITKNLSARMVAIAVLTMWLYSKKFLKLLQNYSTSTYTVHDVAIVDGAGIMNRLFSAKIVLKHPSWEGSQKVIFRFPDDPYEDDVKQHAAVLSFLASKKLHFRTPRLLEYDVREGDGNPLKYPYLLMEYMPGISLDRVYDKLSFQQKLQVVKEVIRLIVALESLSTECAGKLKPANEISDFQSFGVDSCHGQIAFDPFMPERKIGSTLKELININFGYWRQRMIDHPGAAYVQGNDWATFWGIKNEMDRNGYFSKDGCDAMLLHHWDLLPRNIVVQFVSESEKSPIVSSEDPNARVEIAAVIDWDEPRAVPRVLTRMPPKWLWHCHTPHQIPDYYYGRDILCENENDADLFGTDKYGRTCKEPLTNDSLAIKAFFDTEVEKVLPNYVEDAYGSGRWVRRLWKFLIDGIGAGIERKPFKEFLKDWREEHGDSDDESEGEESEVENEEEESDNENEQENSADETNEEGQTADIEPIVQTNQDSGKIENVGPNSVDQPAMLLKKCGRAIKKHSIGIAVSTLALAVLIGNKMTVRRPWSSKS